MWRGIPFSEAFDILLGGRIGEFGERLGWPDADAGRDCGPLQDVFTKFLTMVDKVEMLKPLKRNKIFVY